MGRLADTCSSVFISAAVIACSFLVPCILIGSFSASTYVENRNIRQLYTSSICLLLNYTVLEHQCPRYSFASSPSYKCFDEYFLVSYSIPNMADVTTNITSFKRSEQHEQTEVKKLLFHTREYLLDFNFDLDW